MGLFLKTVLSPTERLETMSVSSGARTEAEQAPSSPDAGGDIVAEARARMEENIINVNQFYPEITGGIKVYTDKFSFLADNRPEIPEEDPAKLEEENKKCEERPQEETKEEVEKVEETEEEKTVVVEEGNEEKTEDSGDDKIPPASDDNMKELEDGRKENQEESSSEKCKTLSYIMLFSREI